MLPVMFLGALRLVRWPRLWAVRIGNVAGNALEDAERSVDYRIVCRAMFTDPQVGAVGLSDQESKAEGYRRECRTILISLCAS